MEAPLNCSACLQGLARLGRQRRSSPEVERSGQGVGAVKLGQQNHAVTGHDLLVAEQQRAEPQRVEQPSAQQQGAEQQRAERPPSSMKSMETPSQVLTICGLSGQVEVAVLPHTTVAEVKASAAQQLGIDQPCPEVPWELVLLDAETSTELSDGCPVELSGCSSESQLVLVRRQKRLYTAGWAGRPGCYVRGHGGAFENAAPHVLEDYEATLRRLDNEDHPWLVDGVALDGVHMGRFQVVIDGVVGREVYINLSQVRQVTQQVKDLFDAICAILGKRNPLEEV